jgi:hypothetical protein
MHEKLERRKHKNSRVKSEQLLVENVFMFGTWANNYNPLAILEIYEE